MTFARVAAIGAGRMGVGIAIAHAMAGVPVDLVDLKERDRAEFERRRDQLDQELAAVEEQLRTHELLGDRTPALTESITLHPNTQAATTLAAADIVYEGVPETWAAKTDALTRLAQLVSAETVIASTTSSMLPSELAELVPHAERFLNVHWLNPAHISPLVEVSSHETTTDAVADRVCESLSAIGKVPVRLGSSPGYIVPRLQALLMNEAARMVAEGVATPEEIDKATRYGLGRRFAALGVLEFIDFGGADILYQASEQLSRTVDAHRYRTPAVIEEMMCNGMDGLRSGSGFYDFPAASRSEYQAGVLARTVATVRDLGTLPEPELQSSERFRGLAGRS